MRIPMYFLYSLIYLIALLLLLPFEWRKRPRGLRKRWIGEKFGNMPFKNNGKLLWIHAVSVGETIASVPLIKAIKQGRPDIKIVLSTITDTGQRVAIERLHGIASVIYMPFDLMFVLNKAVRGLRPTAFIVMETELWPNAFRAMKRAGVPVVMINGRISEGSYRGYGRARFFIKSVLKNMDMMAVQDDVYARRLKDLGASDGNVAVMGNMKFDVDVKDIDLKWIDALDGPVIVAGSTHRGEEQIVLNAYRKLKDEFKGLNLIIAPRHPERFGEAESVIDSSGMKCIKRSSINTGDKIASSVVLLDTVGELAGTYKTADIAVMGGSFIKHGGQNPLEPAAFGTPVVCGPHMWNFPFMKEFYAGGAAAEAADADALCDILKRLLSSSDSRAKMGAAAKAIIERNRGAVKRALDIIERYIK